VPRPVFVLAAQTIGYRRDTFKIIVVQHWTGFPAGLHAFAISVNDAVTGKRVGFPKDTERDYASAAATLACHAVTEEQARSLLERQSKPRERRCEDRRCRARLPLGGLYCTTCGLPGPGQAITGAASLRPARERVAG
jgi:hypothetical protein